MTTSSRVLDAGERSLRVACAELDNGLRTGMLSSVDPIFARYPELESNAEAAVELVFTEYLARESLGQPVEPADYYRRFPQWRDRLERLFQVDELLKEEPAPATKTAGGGDSKLPFGDRLAGKNVSGYELLERIGHGGMGVVYKAVQPGLKRLVALKLLRHGADAPASTQARFRREAELTARLRHPNIVPVFDVGETNGEPYLAMEYVSGGTLRERLQNKILPAADAARLVEKLARAVDYAHGQNVVHRDLKPGNILLEGEEHNSGLEPPTVADSRTNRHDASSELSPRITDFGLAVCREENSALTRQGQILGTPSYMAPEQATGKSDDAGPSVDIYALGAILYECLTGRPPFLAETELETLRQVVEQDPVRPRELQPNAPRDLETVCLKCLHKDPAKRYATAGALADDLGRFRLGEPILARPACVTELAIKWVRRHPTASIAAVVGLLAIASGLVLSAQYATHLKVARDGADLDAVRATAAAKAASEEREKALALAEQLKASLATEERQRRQARAVLDRVLRAMIDEWLVKLPQLTPVQKAILNGVLGDYEALIAATPDDDAGKIGLARATQRVGYMRLILGGLPEAETAYLRAKELMHPYRDQADVRGSYAELLNELGIVYERGNRIAESIALRRDALAAAEAAYALDPVCHTRVHIHAHNALGRVLLVGERPRDALPPLEKAHELARKHGGETDPKLRHEYASVLDALGQCYQLMGKPNEARTAYRDALERLEQIVVERPDDYIAGYMAARVAVNLSTLINNNRQTADEAIEIATRAEARFETLAAMFPGQVKYRHDLGIARNSIANGEMNADRYDRAEVAIRGAIQAYESVLKDSPSLASVRESLGGAYCNFGIILRVNKDLPASLDALTKSKSTLQTLLGSSRSATAKRYTVNASWNLARTLCTRANAESGDARTASVTEALASLRECLEIVPGSLKPFQKLMDTSPDFAPLREDERGKALLDGLKSN